MEKLQVLNYKTSISSINLINMEDGSIKKESILIKMLFNVNHLNQIKIQLIHKRDKS